MKEPINVMILGCGTRNKIVQYFKKELNGKGLVVAADCNELAPALYDADKYYIVPRLEDEGYLESIFTICRENDIKAILSLIDPELSVLAKHKQAFFDIGVQTVVSDYDVVEMCLDKFALYQFLIENGFKTIRSYVDKRLLYKDIEIGLVDYPIIVKPTKGSASININKVSSSEELEFYLNKYDNLLIQEFMDVAEYGVDVYVDLISSEPVAIFAKEKILMRAGETDKSVSYLDKKLFALVRSFIKKARLKGIIDIDIFMKNGDYYISEVNPRFGGGYPHAHECGVNIPIMIINNIDGIANKNLVLNYEHGIFMMKFNEIKIIKKQ